MRRARTCLIDIHHKLVAPLATEDLIRRAHDGISDTLVEAPRLHICQRRRLLHQYRRTNQRRVCAQPTDGKVLLRTARLRTVERLRWHGHIAVRVVLHPYRCRRAWIISSLMRHWASPLKPQSDLRPEEPSGRSPPCHILPRGAAAKRAGVLVGST